VNRRSRIVWVTVGLAAGGAVTGTIAGFCAIELVMLVSDVQVLNLPSVLALSTTFGAPTGAVLLPALSWWLLRNAALGKIVAYLLVGTLAGAIVGFPLYLAGGLGGVVVAFVFTCLCCSFAASLLRASVNKAKLTRSAAWFLPICWFSLGLTVEMASGVGGMLSNPFFAWLIVPAWLLLGAGMFVATCVFAWQAGRSWQSPLLALSVPGALGLLYVLDRPIHAQQIRSYFSARRPVYEEVVRQLGDGSLPRSNGSTERIHYFVDDGSELRVAFPWPGGLADNWFGAIYDPTGDVMRSNQFKSDWSNWKDAELANVKGRFGGDMTGCTRLKAPSWFLCSFT
jgi:hypothetical protein